MKIFLNYILMIVSVHCFAQQDFQLSMEIHARVNQYNTERFNHLSSSASTIFSDNNMNVSLGNSVWEVIKSIAPLDKVSRKKVTIVFKCISGELRNGSVSVDLSFDNWLKDNYLLMPGAVYNGNRYPYVVMDYSPFFTSKDQMGLDKPLMMADGPRLNYRDGLSRLQELSGSMAIPAIGFQSKNQNKGFWLCTTQGNSYGDYGLDVEENKDRTSVTFTITAPVVREVQRHWLTRMDVKPSTDKPANFKAGDTSTITFIIDEFDCPDIQTLYDELSALTLKHYSSPKDKPKLMPMSEAFKIVEEQQNLETWDDEEKHYGKKGWQPGWVGGLIGTYALFTEGRPETRTRVTQTLNWLYPQGLSPMGYYYDIRRDKKFGASKDPKPFGKDLGLTRKNADATYYALKQFTLFKKLSVPVDEKWIQGNFAALNAQVATWKKYGQLGQWINQSTGELVVGNTTSAGIFPAALCEAYRYTGKEDYLDVAKAIGDYYYKNFVVKGIICGGPGDALQSFDSESSFGLVESYVALYEITNDKIWLTRAEEMVHQFASWVVAYDYKFSPESTFGKLDIRTTGLVLANSQNKTAPPGICTHSGIALLKLYRATHNRFYLDLLSDIAHAVVQMMSWKERPIPKYKDGWIFERGGMTDWLEGFGETSAASAEWTANVVLLNYTELPGIYIDIDKGEVFTIDHVNASLSKNKKSLTITNPTPFNATVKVLAETSLQQKTMLATLPFLQYRKVEVRAGQSITIKL